MFQPRIAHQRRFGLSVFDDVRTETPRPKRRQTPTLFVERQTTANRCKTQLGRIFYVLAHRIVFVENLSAAFGIL